MLLPNANEADALESAGRNQRAIWSLALTHAETPSGIVTVSLGGASLPPSDGHDFVSYYQQWLRFNSTWFGRFIF